MATLPIRTLTLYKQGVGYYVRAGSINGTTVALVLPRESTNDVLKSLDIGVERGGPVYSVDYQTPGDKSALLSDLAIKLADRSSLIDLLTSLRGSPVTLTLADGAASSGRIVGVEAAQAADPAAQVIVQAEGELRVVPLADVRNLSLHDERAAQDVTFFLDVSQTEQTRTTLAIRLPEGEHALQVGYLAPGPSWRVSYRLVRDAAGAVRLRGWGLFDNALDEDLDNVELTLISGRPISFEYELFESRVPPRPRVVDDPTDVENKPGGRDLSEVVATLSHELRTPITPIRGFADLLLQGALGDLTENQREAMTTIKNNALRLLGLIEDLLTVGRMFKTHTPLNLALYRSGPLGDLKVSGSYFMPVEIGNADAESLTYRVATPVSVRRGQSALVPILDAPVDCEPLCVFNEKKMDNHPLLVWRLRNTTGVALEQGPVTLSEAGRYLGDGLMRFTGVGDSIEIPYALEFGILIKHERDHHSRTPALVEIAPIERLVLYVSWATITTHTYTLRSHISRAVTVRIERREAGRTTYIDSPEPVAIQQDHIRWAIDVPAQQTAALILNERELRRDQVELKDFSEALFEQLRAANLLAPGLEASLGRLFGLRDDEQRATEQRAGLQAEYEQLLGRQDQLRKNLGALGASQREEALRLRILDDLEQSEERRRLIEARLAELATQLREIEGLRKTIVAHIQGLE